LLGGKIVTMLSYADSPMAEQVSPEWRDKIVHARLTLVGSMLTGVDIRPEQYQRPQGFYVLADIAEPVDAERVFRALAENGEVRMPIQQTFWSVRFEVVVDRFGIPWEISCGQAAAHEAATSHPDDADRHDEHTKGKALRGRNR
jgi:PhnB protein